MHSTDFSRYNQLYFYAKDMKYFMFQRK